MKEWRFRPEIIEANRQRNIGIDTLFYFLIIFYSAMVLIPLYLWIELLIKYHSFDWMFKP